MMAEKEYKKQLESYKTELNNMLGECIFIVCNNSSVSILTETFDLIRFISSTIVEINNILK